MGEGQAYLRMNAARLAQKYPVIISMLATGAVHLSALRQISRFLTDDNHVQLLERLRGKSKREVEKLVAELDPKPDVPSQMRKLPQRAARAGAVSGKSVAARAHSSEPMAQQLLAAPGPASDAGADNCAEVSSPAAVSSCAAVSSAAAEADAQRPVPAMHSKLEQLQHLLRYRIPSGDLAVIIEIGLDLLLAKTMRDRFGIKTPSVKATSMSKRTSTSAGTSASASDAMSTRASEATSNTRSTTSETDFALERVDVTRAAKCKSRYIPRAIRREVYERDEGQCSFVSAEGKRCAERGFIETHHDDPFAWGGEATVGNLMLMCRPHNALLAERDFGRAHVHSKRSQRGSKGNGVLAREPHA